MADMPLSPKLWAVLIGVNFYGHQDLGSGLEGEKRVNRLRGAVEDVHSIKQYLQAQQVDNIRCFTATEPTVTTSSVPEEAPSDWPTYDNITHHLQSVVEQAEPGAKVYLHFSGHGVRPPENEAVVENPHSGDLNLALFDEARGVRYFRTIELTKHYLDALVRKSVFVTVTLDCCFSASVVRHGNRLYSRVRGIPFDPTIDRAYPKRPLDGLDDLDIFRGGRPRSHLYMLGTAYVILVACSEHELAEELDVPKRKGGDDYYQMGGLSHFLLRALKAYAGQSITARTLHEHIRLKFRLSLPSQNPALFGDGDVEFFRGISRRENMQLISTSVRGTKFMLSAGLAHGVVEEDEFTLWSDKTQQNGTPVAHASVLNVTGLEAELVVPDTVRATRDPLWAKRTSLTSRKARIGVMLDEGIDRFLEFSQNKPFLELIRSDQNNSRDIRPNHDFYVINTQKSEYQILDHARKPIELISPVPSGDLVAIPRVIRILEHMATFKYVAEIENVNPNADFERSFSLSLSRSNGSLIEGYVTATSHEEELTLKVENLSEHTLYLAILMMGPMWDIDEILSYPDGQRFRNVSPKKDRTETSYGTTGQQCVPIKMTVDQALVDQGLTKCKDIIKVFVTSEPSPFHSLYQGNITDIEDDTTRGNYHNISSLLSSLSEAWRGGHGSETDKNWSVITFSVETSK
ncbi:hypothetical protein PG984_012917 [Apiospora sp. TS-2023a]